MALIKHGGLTMREQMDYCLSAKPKDFYTNDSENLHLNYEEIEVALSIAKNAFQVGSRKSAMLLVCKIAQGYKEYCKSVELRRGIENKEEQK